MLNESYNIIESTDCVVNHLSFKKAKAGLYDKVKLYKTYSEIIELQIDVASCWDV